jgi:hypothetical protein
VSQIYFGKVKITKCLKAHSLKRSADRVSPGTISGRFTLLVDFRHLSLWSLVACRIVNDNFGAWHLFSKASSTGGCCGRTKYQPPTTRLLEY